MKPGKIRTAFILGAGLGIRLRPLTENCPKPLLSVCGRPLITYAMDHCLSIGIGRFIVNTHHCPAAYDRAFPERLWRGRPILSRHEPVLLDAAGGLKNIEDLLDEDETLLVYNGDVISDLPLGRLLDAHAAGGKEVTLALRSSGPVRNVCLDKDGAVCDLRDLLGNPGVRRCLFTGIYLVEKRFLKRLTPGKVESVIPVFVEMIRETPGSVGGAVIDEGIWKEIGDPEAYARINSEGLTLHGKSHAGGPHALENHSFRLASGLPGEAGATHRPTSDVVSTPDGSRDWGAMAFVRKTLSLPEDAGFVLLPVGRGGSDRDYFRVAIPGRRPAILMRYSRSREENDYYEAIAGFLQKIGVAVPSLRGHDPERGLLLMEDLGDEDLFFFRNAAWETRRDLYEKTLTIASRLHSFPPECFPVASVRLMPGFGPELYKWERDYFLEQCIRKFCRIDLSVGEEKALETELAALSRRLMEKSQVLIHRDLQSQNVMIREKEPFLIDFQGMRLGSPFYDLASLLQDPYVDFSGSERSMLLRYYYDLSRSSYGWEEFIGLFLFASAQRLMQALGAYGFLGLERGKPHFFAYIAPALDRLIEVAAQSGQLHRLHALARRCRSAIV